MFYGSDSSPAYDWTADDEERYIDPVVKEAYEKAVQNREPGTQSVFWMPSNRFSHSWTRTTDNLLLKFGISSNHYLNVLRKNKVVHAAKKAAAPSLRVLPLCVSIGQ